MLFVCYSDSNRKKKHSFEIPSATMGKESKSEIIFFIKQEPLKFPSCIFVIQVFFLILQIE